MFNNLDEWCSVQGLGRKGSESGRGDWLLGECLLGGGGHGGSLAQKAVILDTGLVVGEIDWRGVTEEGCREALIPEERR